MTPPHADYFDLKDTGRQGLISKVSLTFSHPPISHPPFPPMLIIETKIPLLQVGHRNQNFSPPKQAMKPRKFTLSLLSSPLMPLIPEESYRLTQRKECGTERVRRIWTGLAGFSPTLSLTSSSYCFVQSRFYRTVYPSSNLSIKTDGFPGIFSLHFLEAPVSQRTLIK